MSSILAPRSLLIFVGLPAIVGFASLKKGGDSGGGISVRVEEAGDECVWSRPDLSGYPTDACSYIGTEIKPITDPDEWCGKRKTSEDCMPDSPAMVVKQAAQVTTEAAPGTAVLYDICVWDACEGKCRLAEWSYRCATTCPGVPDAGQVARSPADEGVTRTITCSRKAENNPGITPRFVYADSCTVRLIGGGRRLAEEEKPPKAKKGRKMQADCKDMNTGDECCEVTDAPVTDAFVKSLNSSALFQSFVTCRFQTGVLDEETNQYSDDQCNCEVAQSVPIGSSSPDCPANPPIAWGTNGGRRQ